MVAGRQHPSHNWLGYFQTHTNPTRHCVFAIKVFYRVK
jgi:hypothetical protein